MTLDIWAGSISGYTIGITVYACLYVSILCFPSVTSIWQKRCQIVSSVKHGSAPSTAAWLPLLQRHISQTFSMAFRAYTVDQRRRRTSKPLASTAPVWLTSRALPFLQRSAVSSSCSKVVEARGIISVSSARFDCYLALCRLSLQ